MANNDSEVGLLFRIKAEAAQTATASKEAQAAVRALKTAFTSELGQIQKVGQETFGKVRDHAREVTNEIPLIGGAVGKTIDFFQRFTSASGASEKQLANYTKQVQDLSTKTGKSTGEITNFLAGFVKIEGQAKRDAAALKFVGAAAAQDLIPNLEAAGKELGVVAAASEGAGGALGALAGPIGIAVLAVAALVGIAIIGGKELVDLSSHATEVQAQLYDMSQQTGVSTESLSALRVEARLVGSDIGAVSASLGIFQRNMESALDPASKMGKKFRELGIDTDNTEQALRQAFMALAKMPEGFAQTAAALDLFGRGGKVLLAILKSTNGDLDESIAKLQKLGLITSTEAAGGADRFQDSLALLQLQTDALSRSLQAEFVPAAFELVRALQQFATENKEAFRDMAKAAGELAHVLGTVLTGAIQTVGSAWRAERPVLDFLDKVQVKLDKISEYIDAINEATDFETLLRGVPAPDQIEPPKVPGLQPVPLATTDQERRLQQLRAEVAASVRFSEEQASKIERQIRAREIGQAQGVEALIGTEKSRSEALLQGIEERLTAKAKEWRAAEIDKERQTKIGGEIIDLQQQQADEELRIRKFEEDKRAELRAQQLQNEQAHRRRVVQATTQGLQDQIDTVRRAASRGEVSELGAQQEAEDILAQIFRRRRDLLKQELYEAGADVAERTRVKDELDALQREQTNSLRVEAERRKGIMRAEAEARVQTLLIALEATERVIRVTEAGRAAALEALRGRIGNEEAERQLGEIRAAQIKREIDATEAAIKRTNTILDPKKRAEEEARLKGKLKELNAERVADEQDTNRKIAEGRQTDLDDLADYTREVQELRDRATEEGEDADDAERESGLRRVLSRIQVIDLQADSEKRAADREHRQREAAIRDEERQARERLAKIKHTKEDEEAITKASNARLEAEKRRHEAVIKGIDRRAEDDRKRNSPFGNLTEGLQAGIDKFKETGDAMSNVAQAMGGIIDDALKSVSQAIGGLVEQWVLMGETGPAALRRIAAATLASVAAQAAVYAVYYLGLALAAVFLDPPAAAGLFAASAVMAGIAGVAALAGRALAGDLFKPKAPGTTAAGARGGGGGTAGSTNPAQVINMERNRVVVDVHIHAEPGFIAKSVVREIDNNNKQLNDGLRRATGTSGAGS